ncbi:MAG: hypothetical protein IJZ72_07725 [Oscillospiraceae bacterium]|nr:hypothetical protein [Oscillospiraceae bacterium]
MFNFVNLFSTKPDRMIQEFLNGYKYFAGYAFSKLPDIYKDSRLVNEIAAQFTTIIKECHYADMTEKTLQQLFYDSVPSNHDNLKDFDFKLLKDSCGSEENFISVLIAGAVHPNGWCRQNCLKLLADYPETLPYIIPRMNDWVTPVRETANKSALKAAENCSLNACAKGLVALSKFRYKGRYSHEWYNKLTELLKKRFSDLQGSNSLVSLIYHTDKSYAIDSPEKKILYRTLIENRLLSLENVRYLSQRENNPVCRIFILVKALSFYDFTDSELLEFTHSRQPLLRLKALRLLTERGVFPREDIERLLMDRCKAVREAAVYAFKKHSDTDLHEFYLNLFPKPEAVLAFAAMSSAEDEKYFLPLLNSERSKVKAAAISALCFINADAHTELFYSEVLKSEACVSKAAFQALRACEPVLSPERLYNDIISTDSLLLKRRLITLLCSQTSPLWERMPYLLRLYDVQTKHYSWQEKEWQSNIQLTIAKRSIYVRISPDTAAKIRLALKECPLPDKLVWEIEHDLKNLT